MSINIGETDTDSDWNDLKIFLAVARSGTQAFAAEVLGQSQPTVGRRIRALERSLGSTLFYRDARGLGLTDDGAVKQIEVMDYREIYGGQVRDEKWRAQFIGKKHGARLKLDDDIQNISGATLSSGHITEGVRRLLATHALVLKK